MYAIRDYFEEHSIPKTHYDILNPPSSIRPDWEYEVCVLCRDQYDNNFLYLFSVYVNPISDEFITKSPIIYRLVGINDPKIPADLNITEKKKQVCQAIIDCGHYKNYYYIGERNYDMYYVKLPEKNCILQFCFDDTQHFQGFHFFGQFDIKE